jgi:hypothetical protein
VQRLNLKYDEPLSHFAFSFNLRHYIMVARREEWGSFIGEAQRLDTSAMAGGH